VPIPVAAYPPWLLSGDYEADDAGLRRVDTVRVVDGRPLATVVRVPFDEIRRVAEAQPPLHEGWQPSEPDDLMVEAVTTEEPVDVNTAGPGGRTPLMDAVVARERDVVDALLQQGADVNAKDETGLTPLFLAINIFDTDTVIVNRLLDAGADIETRGVTGTTPLIEAAVIKNDDLFRLLLRRGADPCARDDGGVTIVGASEGPFPELNRMAREAHARCP
jgi:hypothetical protein